MSVYQYINLSCFISLFNHLSNSLSLSVCYRLYTNHCQENLDKSSNLVSPSHLPHAFNCKIWKTLHESGYLFYFPFRLSILYFFPLFFLSLFSVPSLFSFPYISFPFSQPFIPIQLFLYFCFLSNNLHSVYFLNSNKD